MKHETVTKTDRPESQQGNCCAKPLSTSRSDVHLFRQLHQTIGNQHVGRLIQTKLAISQPGDRHEQEADRVADEVMRMAQPVHVQQQRESSETQISRQGDDSGPTHVMIFRGVPHFLDCETSELDTDPNTSCCSSHTRSLIPGLYTTSREFTDRAIERMASGANMDGAISSHFGSDALWERSEILSRLRIIRAELDEEATHVILCRIALSARNAIGFDLLTSVDRRLFCQTNVQASARVGGNIATLCVDADGNPAGGWETLLHEMVHLSGVGNLPDRTAASAAQTTEREYETYEHEREEGLYPNPMPFSLRNADSFSSFVAEIGADSWSAESNIPAYLPTVEAGGLLTLEGVPRFGVTGGVLFTPFGSDIQPIIGARALWFRNMKEKRLHPLTCAPMLAANWVCVG